MKHIQLSKYLNEQVFEGLNIEQKTQITKQILDHNHTSTEVLDIEVNKDLSLKAFQILPTVMKPYSSQVLAKYIFTHPTEFKNKTVLDLGSGTGILGIMCELVGASKVTYSDINPLAIENTKINISSYLESSHSQFIICDLFDKINSLFDIIIFAQPYFGSKPLNMLPVSYGMLDDGDLINRFFEIAKPYFLDAIYMVYWDFVGETNDPYTVSRKYNYDSELVYQEENLNSLQKGNISVCRITKQLK